MGSSLFFLTGASKKSYSYWSDMYAAASTVRISDEPDGNWTPKAYTEREIRMPANLVKKLKTWKAKSDKTCGFPISGCNPNLDFLSCSKACEAGEAQDKGILAAQISTLSPRCLWAS